MSAVINDVAINTMKFIPGTIDHILVCTNSSRAYIINPLCQTLQTFETGKKSGGDILAAAISSQGKQINSYCICIPERIVYRQMAVLCW
jgi:hypothetical protein